MNGKGDRPRPVNKKKYNENYEKVFNNMKFYEVKQQMNNLHWYSLGYFQEKSLAKKYEKLFNTRVLVHPIKTVEHEFLTEKDVEE